MAERRKPSQDQYVVCAGRHLAVEFYYTEDGQVPAEGFYDSRSEDEKRRFLHIVEHLANQPPGRLLPRAMFNLEDNAEKIFAIKPVAARYLGFFTHDRKFIITETYVKQTQRLGSRERRMVNTAIQRKRDYAERTRRGDYYEQN